MAKKHKGSVKEDAPIDGSDFNGDEQAVVGSNNGTSTSQAGIDAAPAPSIASSVVTVPHIPAWSVAAGLPRRAAAAPVVRHRPAWPVHAGLPRPIPPAPNPACAPSSEITHHNQLFDYIPIHLLDPPPPNPRVRPSYYSLMWTLNSALWYIIALLAALGRPLPQLYANTSSPLGKSNRKTPAWGLSEKVLDYNRAFHAVEDLLKAGTGRGMEGIELWYGVPGQRLVVATGRYIRQLEEELWGDERGAGPGKEREALARVRPKVLKRKREAGEFNLPSQPPNKFEKKGPGPGAGGAGTGGSGIAV